MIHYDASGHEPSGGTGIEERIDAFLQRYYSGSDDALDLWLARKVFKPIIAAALSDPDLTREIRRQEAEKALNFSELYLHNSELDFKDSFYLRAKAEYLGQIDHVKKETE